MKPVLGSEIVGYSKLGKHEHENKTGGIRVPFTEASSPLSESLEQATRIGTVGKCEALCARGTQFDSHA